MHTPAQSDVRLASPAQKRLVLLRLRDFGRKESDFLAAFALPSINELPAWRVNQALHWAWKGTL